MIRNSFAGSWARPLLGVFRDGDRVTGAVGAVCRGLRTTRSPRAPLFLDVRLPAHSNAPTWCLPEGADGRELIRTFERAAVAELGWRLAGVVYRMVTEPALPLVARRGAVVRQSPGTTELSLAWSTVDGWIGTLSRNRRSTLRRQIKRIAQDGELNVREGSARRDLDPAELAALDERHAARLSSSFDPRLPLSPAYFAALLGREDVWTLSYHHDGRLLAFAMVYDHPVAPAYGPWAALPPEQGGRKDLYFDSYARIVAHASAAGAKSLFAGRGFLDVKRSLGFAHLPMKVVAVPRWAVG
ncbi:GNAT family N-acetyltransferase [Nonomuraea sp. NPDC050790]|uniref:GNAT family N-acetyltransferase n=1 Tax=Nonomuraea sp. NPDC050790 TaxID=3364371 RepID=UPI00379C7843